MWIGWSLGGMVALANAIARPGSVSRLVTVAATPRFVTGDGWPHAVAPEDLARVADDLGSDFRRTVSNFLALQVHGDEHARALLRDLRPRLFAHGEPDARGLAAGLEILRATDLRARLGEVRAPLLAVGGGRDRLVPPAAGAALARAVVDGRSVVFARAAHAPFLSDPKRFLELVEEFLGHSRRAAPLLRHDER